MLHISIFSDSTTRVITFIIACMVLTSSCSSEEPNPARPIIYIAGYERSTTAMLQNQATLWKNGNPIRLTDGTREAIAYSVTVSAGDVYVAGFERNQANVMIPKYWKNGTAVSLTNGTSYGWATDVAVAGSDVYATGYTADFGAYKATLWKNGTAQVLTDGTNEAIAEAVWISGPDVYVAGWEYHAPAVIAKYWKNGEEVLLSDGTTIAFAKSIGVLGEDVYVCGTENGRATLWKNGEPARLGILGRVTSAEEMKINGSDIYVVGTDITTNPIKPCYWKNGTQLFLESPDPVRTRSIAVFNNDVYVTGSGSAGAGRWFCQYWKNEKPDRLTTNNQDAYAWSIYVAP